MRNCHGGEQTVLATTDRPERNVDGKMLHQSFKSISKSPVFGQLDHRTCCLVQRGNRNLAIKLQEIGTENIPKARSVVREKKSKKNIVIDKLRRIKSIRKQKGTVSSILPFNPPFSVLLSPQKMDGLTTSHASDKILIGQSAARVRYAFFCTKF